ncbi:hypothetical protein [Streptomyces xiamenensis]|uniref:hypothetical protein n=1 Tax=Streptomyces xiamenensis TaxID=408015 RepID=UPI003D734B52
MSEEIPELAYRDDVREGLAAAGWRENTEGHMVALSGALWTETNEALDSGLDGRAGWTVAFDSDVPADVIVAASVAAAGSALVDQQRARAVELADLLRVEHERANRAREAASSWEDEALAVRQERDALRQRVAELEQAAVDGRYALAALVNDHDDPGAEALGALWRLRQATIGLTRGADETAEVMARHDAAVLDSAADFLELDQELEDDRQRAEHVTISPQAAAASEAVHDVVGRLRERAARTAGRTEVVDPAQPDERVEQLQAALSEALARQHRYRTAWRRARTRGISLAGAADRYAARSQELQAALQDMTAHNWGLLIGQSEREARLRAAWRSARHRARRT